MLSVTLLAAAAAAEGPHEIVERKGRGHPDSICDALAESLSTALSRFYLDRFGQVLHHNVDKALLIGGAAQPAFGGGEILEPIEIILAGRATRNFRGVAVPVDELAVETSRAWLDRHLRGLDAGRHVRITPRIRETSPDLNALFLRRGEGGAPLANDSSFGAAFAPFDRLERAVLAVDGALGAGATRQAHPEVGEDVKVLGARSGKRMDITVACAFVGRHVANLADYFAKKDKVRRLAAAAADGAEVLVNAADGETAQSIYLTVSGLSAESGDDGEVGRGNRANGLITPYRPMSLEAVAGKNPVTHTGKLYNLLAGRIAGALAENLEGVQDAHCHLLSRIGSPVDDPQLADIRLRMEEPRMLERARAGAIDIVRAQLAAAPQLWRELLGLGPA